MTEMAMKVEIQEFLEDGDFEVKEGVLSDVPLTARLFVFSEAPGLAWRKGEKMERVRLRGFLARGGVVSIDDGKPGKMARVRRCDRV